MADTTTQTAQQDALRTVRQFISGLYSSGSDQTYAGQDAYAVNQPYQYQTIGSNGAVAVEGAAVSNAQTAAKIGSPLVILGVVVVAYLLLKA